MKICFQADADPNQNIVRALRRRAPALDFQTAHEAGLHGVDDEAVLAQAAREGRILVSHRAFSFVFLVPERALNA